MSLNPTKIVQTATAAAQVAGVILRKNLNLPKDIDFSEQHDIKLALDVRCQKLIEKRLRTDFREIPILGEEGILGDVNAEFRWVVDPIDGTVNFTYGIPHACVSIAFQQRVAGGEYQTLAGVVYDPFCGELWTAIRGGKALLNGKPTRVSPRKKLDEAIISIGFAKKKSTLNLMLPLMNWLIHRVRKVRIMGSAALALTYVASGRNEAYVEAGVRLWDIAAGGLILECAGGDPYFEKLPGEYRYKVIANNGHFRAPFLKKVRGVV